MLEVGPRTTTATLARQQAKDLKQQIAIASLSDRVDDDAEWTALLQAVGQLWLAGVEIDRDRFYGTQTRHRIPLPTYPFDRQRFWIDPLPHPQLLVNKGKQENISTTATLDKLPPLQPQSEIARIDRSETQIMPAASNNGLIILLKEVIEETSGLEMAGVDRSTTFLEMGLDSDRKSVV